ncbi:MAG: hypothetical protein OHK0036_18830 [Bacteroidia bacterium]
MAILLNKRGLAYAQYQIDFDEVESNPCDWKDHKPTQDEVDKFLNTHYMSEYGQWFLGINTDYPRETKEHYIYPHGDLKIVHRSAVELVEKEAQTNEIKEAARKLLQIIDKKARETKK